MPLPPSRPDIERIDWLTQGHCGKSRSLGLPSEASGAARTGSRALLAKPFAGARASQERLRPQRDLGMRVPSRLRLTSVSECKRQPSAARARASSEPVAGGRQQARREYPEPDGAGCRYVDRTQVEHDHRHEAVGSGRKSIDRPCPLRQLDESPGAQHQRAQRHISGSAPDLARHRYEAHVVHALPLEALLGAAVDLEHLPVVTDGNHEVAAHT